MNTTEHVSPKATLVWTNAYDQLGGQFFFPKELGTPRDDQFCGNNLDRLSEVAGRVCYDSCGTGRSSVDYHRHIREVKHNSVLRHGVFTLMTDVEYWSYVNLMTACMNRPGVYVTHVGVPNSAHRSVVRITVNLQAAVEWRERFPAFCHVPGHDTACHTLERHVKSVARRLAPLVMAGDATLGPDPAAEFADIRPVLPVYPDEVYFSFLLSGVSRGLTHELVRHTWQCAPSQESTRYVDMEDDPWVMHPLFRKSVRARESFLKTRDTCAEEYAFSRQEIETDLLAQGFDKHTARKQARGAARGLLGNALGTRILFTASATQWKTIFAHRLAVNQNGHPVADMEIHEALLLVKDHLTTRFPEHFPRD